MSSFAPPQAPPNFALSPSALASTCTSAIKRSRELQDKIAKISDPAFDTVILPLAYDEALLEVETAPLVFLQNVSPDKDVRDASLAADKALNEFGIESSMRLDVFEAVKAASKHTSSQSLDHESKRLVERMLRDGRRAGLDLSAKDRDKAAALKKDIAARQVAWSKINNDEAGFTDFSKEELEGVPDSVLDGLAKREEAGKTLYRVTNKTPDYMPVMANARRSETRKKLFLAYENRLADAASDFKKIIELRRELTKVLKAPTWADHVLEIKMAKDAKTARAFIDALIEKLTPIGKAERARLIALKKELDEAHGFEHDPTLKSWDYRYLDEAYQKKTLDLDNEKIKEYFPVEFVLDRIFAIYQRLLGVRMKKVDGKLWHEDVQGYTVWEDDDTLIESGKGYLGMLYLDIYPRDNKYSHDAVFSLIPGYDKEDGSRSMPVAAYVGNLAQRTTSQPALMPHAQVVTFMHELGHAYHHVLSTTRYARFHGMSVARDFVEAPSQMLENWCYTASTLKSISSHYKTQEPLPDSLIENIIKSENVNGGLFNLRQLFFGKFDQLIHTSFEDLDLEKLWCDLREEVSLVAFDGEYRPGYAYIGHYVQGYDASYYGYLFSQCFSVDMFATVFGPDPMSHEAGLRYRQEILRPGSSRDETDSLQKFLGRPPSNEAFMKKLLSNAPQNGTTHL